MISTINADVHSNAVRTELRLSAGLKVQQCFWTPISGYRPGDLLPLIIHPGLHPDCIRARWEGPGDTDGLAWAGSGRRGLLPATAVHFQVPSVRSAVFKDEHRFRPVGQDWFAIACSYWRGDDGQTAFKVCTIAAEDDRVGIISREPMIVPRIAWKRWLDPKEEALTCWPRPGTVGLEPFSVW